MTGTQRRQSALRLTGFAIIMTRSARKIRAHRIKAADPSWYHHDRSAGDRDTGPLPTADSAHNPGRAGPGLVYPNLAEHVHVRAASSAVTSLNPARTAGPRPNAGLPAAAGAADLDMPDADSETPLLTTAHPPSRTGCNKTRLERPACTSEVQPPAHCPGSTARARPTQGAPELIEGTM